MVRLSGRLPLISSESHRSPAITSQGRLPICRETRIHAQRRCTGRMAIASGVASFVKYGSTESVKRVENCCKAEFKNMQLAELRPHPFAYIVFWKNALAAHTDTAHGTERAIRTPLSPNTPSYRSEKDWTQAAIKQEEMMYIGSQLRENRLLVYTRLGEVLKEEDLFIEIVNQGLILSLSRVRTLE